MNTEECRCSCNPYCGCVCHGSKLGWKLAPAGNVVLTMTPDDWAKVLLVLGSGSQAMSGGTMSRLAPFLALMNRLNAGNPHYRPYEVPPEASRGK